MAYKLRYLPGAWRDLAELPREVAARAQRALERIADDPRLGKPLHRSLALLRSYRVGDYRIVYQVRDREVVVLVVMVGHRRSVYEQAKRRTSIGSPTRS